MKKIAITAALVALIPATYVTVQHMQEKPQPAQPVKEAYVAAEGKVEALPGFDVNIGTGELNGKVGKILVKEGESVKAGQVVAILQNEDLAAAVKRAEGDLLVAKSKLKEIESGARPQEIKEAEAALQGAKATLEEASRQVVRYRTLQKQGMVSPADLDSKERTFEGVLPRRHSTMPRRSWIKPIFAHLLKVW